MMEILPAMICNNEDKDGQTGLQVPSPHLKFPGVPQVQSASVVPQEPSKH